MPWIYGLESEYFSYSSSSFYATNLRTWPRMFKLLANPLLWHESMDLNPNISVTRRPAFMPWIYGLDPECFNYSPFPFLPWIYGIDSERYIYSPTRFMPRIYGLDSECFRHSPSRLYAMNLTDLIPNVSVARQPAFMAWVYGLDSECFSYSPLGFIPWLYGLNSECLNFFPSHFMPWIYGLDSKYFSYSPPRFHAMILRTWLRLLQVFAVPLLYGTARCIVYAVPKLNNVNV